jgi:O-6-methylguanine DNA methyltransferase
MCLTGQVSYWIFEEAFFGTLRLAASESGLCYVGLRGDDDQAFFGWLERVVQPQALIKQRSKVTDHALVEIRSYLSAELRTFITPLDPYGTPFQRQVWAEVASIAYGETTTYAAIAARIGRPHAARAIGAANAANPLPLFVPCHRVLGTDGRLRGYGGGLQVKAALLALESSVR